MVSPFSTAQNGRLYGLTPMTMPAKIGVIEDQQILLELLADLCGKIGYNVVFTAANATTGMLRLREAKPDALLVDINLPDGDGIQLAKLARRERPMLKVIALSSDTRPETVRRVREAGLHGYVSKFTWSTCLREALENVLEHGKPYYSRTMQVPDAPYVKMLTARELQVLPFIAVGHADTEIAEIGALAPATVRKHRERIMHKLDLKTRADLLRFCFREGFLKNAPDGSLISPQWVNNPDQH